MSHFGTNINIYTLTSQYIHQQTVFNFTIYDFGLKNMITKLTKFKSCSSPAFFVFTRHPSQFCPNVHNSQTC